MRSGLVTLTGDVHSAYERDRASTVAARTIGVQEVQNLATLKGVVDDWSERKAALDNAYDGGAIAVIDRLEVEPFGS